MKRAMAQNKAGFTLFEAMVVIVMIALLSAVAAPAWLNFMEKARLTAARDRVHLGIQAAQTQAQANSTSWQFSLRETNGSLEWAVHPQSVAPNLAQWQSLESQSLRINDETTFDSSSGTYYVRFDAKGNPQQLGRITLSGERFSKNKRCVIVSTLIGATRKAQEQTSPDPNYRTRDRFCY